MLAIACPTSSFPINESCSSEPENPKSSWKGSFDAFWKTHRTSILVGSGLAVAAAFTAVLHARQVTVPEPANPFPTCPAPHFPVPQNIFGLSESRSIAALPKQSSVQPLSFQIRIDQSEKAASSLADLTETQFTELNGTPSLDPVVSSEDVISHNSHQAGEEGSCAAECYPASDLPKLNNPAPGLFSPNFRAMPWNAFSSDIPISLISESPTSANCFVDFFTQNKGRLDPVNQDNSTTPLLPLIPTVEKSNILTQAWESVAPLAYDTLNQFGSYLQNGLSEGRDELSFNPFSLRVIYDIGLLGGTLYYTHSRGIYLSPGDQSLLALGAVKTFRDIFMPPLSPSFASSVVKSFAVVIFGYLKLSGAIN